MTEITGNNSAQTALEDTDGNPISANFPLQVDGDSIYSKDINSALSDVGDFSGDILTLFNDYETEIVDSTANNPKILIIHLVRPVKSNQIGIGSKTGDFSNVKISLKDLAGTVRTVIDDSASDTKHSSNVYSFTTNVFIEISIEFHTADTVTISGMYVPKVQSRAISAIDGFISAKNSSLTPLGIGGVFQGEAENSRDYGALQVALFSDQACTFLIEGRSTPTSTWREIDTYPVAAGEDKAWSFQGVRQFIRVTVTNGAIAQTEFDLQVMFKPVYIKPSSHPMGGVLKSNDDAEAVKAGIAGFSEIDGEPENVSTFRRALQVDNALVHRAGVNELFRQLTGVGDTTLAVASIVDDFTIEVAAVDVSWTDVAPGTQLIINGELYHFHITNIAGTVLTIDRRLDSAHAIGTTIKEITTAMNVDGTLAAPEVFIIAPPNDPPEIWQITRIITSLTSASSMDDGRFGSRVELPNGAILRANRNGVFRTGTVWKNNGDMALDQFDLTYTDRAPGGDNGLRGRWTFTKAEFVVELDGSTNDYLAIYVQDVLSSQASFQMKAQGRIFGA
jgi:hypothetical protein